MSSVSARPTHAPELIEREVALESLDSALGEAIGGHGSLALITADAGGGKTALLEAFCAAQTPRTRVLRGACDALFTPRPLGPILDIARQAGPELDKLLHEDALPYRAAVALIENLSEDAPTILVVEDVHWADDATLDVLRLIARRIDPLQALVVLTYREEEVGAAHPLRIVLGELVSSLLVTRVALPPLSLEAVTQLAEPYGVDPGELHETTGGNPFFVTEVLASGGAEIPPTVRDAVLARAARLGQEARAVLEAVAIAPPQAELWLVEALTGALDSRMDECIESGMLVSTERAVAFRHELARLAVEEALTSGRKLSLHRAALETLTARDEGEVDLARLAHHADGAGDRAAVLRFAPAAGAHAASVGAHREAAEQYARALRYASGLPPGKLAELLTRRSRECYLTDEADEAIEALRTASSCYRNEGDRLKEGETLAKLSNILWCPGRGKEAREVGLEAVHLLESLPPGRELADAYANLSFLYRQVAEIDEARSWGLRSLELAERLDDSEAVCGALLELGQLGGEQAGRQIERALTIAEQTPFLELLVDAYFSLALRAVRRRAWSDADEYVEKGLHLATEHGNDLMRLYLLATRALAELEQGRWTQAADSARSVLGEHMVSTLPRTYALVVLALVRARRGDPDVEPLLDEALVLAEPTGELSRIAPVAAARAEAAWLRGDPEAVVAETGTAIALARRGPTPRIVGELQRWRRRAGIGEDAEPYVERPDALELAGEPKRAAAMWTELGCPYEAALALAQTDSEEALRSVLEELTILDAKPAAAIVARKLRERGARDVPRGPRSTTRESPAGLTTRETEVLQLVAEGLRNAEIAERLVVSARTVDHHVSAILRKLDAGSRGEAGAVARRLGLLEDR